MNNSIESYRQQLKKALSKQYNAWNFGKDVGWDVQWDPKSIVFSPENALNARYQILGVRAGDRSHNLKIALRIVVWPKSEDKATDVQWFHDQRFKEKLEKKLAKVSNLLLPISIGWRVIYAVKPPSDDVARLGSWVLGEQFLGESGMINKIMNIVEGLNYKESNWQEKLRQELDNLFAAQFKDGQVITASDINLITTQLRSISNEVEQLKENCHNVDNKEAEINELKKEISDLKKEISDLKKETSSHIT